MTGPYEDRTGEQAHPSPAVLSDWFEQHDHRTALLRSEPADGDGQLEPSSDPVGAHLSRCPSCRLRLDDLAGVRALLAADPTPTMPADVFARLDDLVAVESANRQAASAGRSYGDPRPRPVLGTFRPTAPPRAGRARFGKVVGGLLLAGVLGCAGYLISASLGTDQPSAGTALTVDPSALASQVATIDGADLRPHRFSPAWRCARKVTDGEITGIKAVEVGDQPSFLVYTSAPTGARATLVTGCSSGEPEAGVSVPVPGR